MSTRALSPRGIRVALLAMMLVGMAFWPVAADAGEPAEPVWSADMTVVEYSSVSIGAASADLFSNVGGSGNLQIKSLWSHIPGGDLRLAFEESVPNAADYTLRVGGLSLEFPEDSSGDRSFKWNDVDVDWQDGQLIRVRIVPTAESDAQQPNTPATGVPTISGTAQVGETLAADTSGIADADGLSTVSYAYQWLADDTEIDGATSSTYTLRSSDNGKAIKVQVDFTDDAGNAESLTSAGTSAVATKANIPASGLPAISGTARVGYTLTAVTSAIGDADGLSRFPYAYQWIRSNGGADADIADATDPTYALTDDDEGKTIKLRVTFNDDKGNRETLTSAATAEVGESEEKTQFLVGNLGINVATGIMRPLSAARSGFAQAFTTGTKTDGYPLGSVGIQVSDFSDGWSVGDHLQVTINGVAGEGGPGDAHCTLTNPSSFPAPGVSAFEAPTGAGSCPQLATETTYFVVIEWLNPSGTGSFALIPQTYPTKETAATEENPGGAEGWSIADRSYYLTVSSDARTWTAYDETASFKIKVKEAAVGLPAITGTAQVGETLTADTSAIADEDGLDDVSYSYQWLADDTEIDGATSSTYTPQSSDNGKVIKVRVTFTDDAGNQESLTSAATDAVAAKPNTTATGLPTISGTAQVGETLTADTSPIADEDGLDDVSYSYQWLADSVDIQGATGNTYILVAADVGKTITVLVSFTDDGGNEERLTSAVTAVVAYVDGPPGAPREVNVQAGDTELLVSWQPPAEENKAPVAQYRILYREEGGSNQELHTSHLSQEIGNLTNGVTYSVQVTAKNAAGYGTPSDEVSETPDTLPPWAAKMLVVEYTSVSIGAASADLFSNAWGSAGLQVKSLWSHITDRDLRLSFEDGVPDAADYTLKVGDLTLEFPAGSSGQSSFRWTDVDVDWEDGQTISVRIVPTSATAEVTPQPNSPATGAPAISGTAQVGETSTADTSGIADANGLTNVTFNYQWIRSDNVEIAGATNSTYTLTDADLGKAIKVKVSFTDDADNEETLTSQATGVVAAKPNNPATGAPTIDGTAQVGETLTALTNGITDEDGLTNVSYRYQWLADGTDIEGATGSSYTLTSSEQGQAIQVRVDSTDDANNAETLTSVATVAVAAAANNPATGVPTISGTVRVGEALTADTSGISDGDGLTNVSYSHQWIRSDGGTDTDLEGETASTYTLAGGDVDKAIKVKVSFTDDANNQESLTSAATDAVAATVPTAPLSLTVTAGSQIQELDVSWQAPSSNGGSAVTGYKVQWKESTDSWDTAADVSEATETGTTHTITGLTGGVEYAVRVIAYNDVGDGPASTEVKGTPAGGVSEQTVEPENSAPTGLPSISGTPQVDRTLTADTSNIDDEDGLTNVSYRYQWGAGGSDIEGAIGSTYTLTYSEQGQTIQVQVSFTDDANNEETLTSQATVAVAAAPNREATGQPTISGTPQVGQTLTADTANIADEDGLTNPTFAYQWRGGGLTIIGATDSTYTLTASDQGKTITVRVRFIDDRNSIESRISNATTAVAAAPNRQATGKPTIGGTPQVGETLTAVTADTANIADEDGLTNVSYRYQWLAGGSDISGATGSTHTLTASEQGQTIQVRVTFTDDRDNAEALTSIATAAVAAAPEPLTVRLKVAAPATHDGSSEFTFEIEFSEEFGLSYKTLRDHVFNVTGGSVEKAQRTDKPSNIPWLITVKPQRNGDVTIELPATMDCDAEGAICTGDGRKLSNSLNFTVSGPGQ